MTSKNDQSLIICGMWGTSNLTVSLVDGNSGTVLESRTGRGVSRLANDQVQSEFFNVCDGWLGNDDGQVSHAFLGGMVGSTIGWWDVPYVDCPIEFSQLSKVASSKLIDDISVNIAPGLKCTNFLGEQDVLRGEEIELLAWSMDQVQDNAKRSLVCIPGTHTKWVEVVGRKITRFQTSVVGELFDVLTSNGVLASKNTETDEISSIDAFIGGVKAAVENPDALVHLLMSVRSRSVLGRQTSAEASDRLSGLLIGADICKAFDLADFTHDECIIPVIGSPNLVARYQIALEQIGASVTALDSLPMGVVGLFKLSKDMRGLSCLN